MGISREHFIKIFDPYFSTKQKGSEKGMGLGLTVSLAIIKNHGGHITVTSEVGVGTTFHIYLPSAQEIRGKG
jgi:signal transduction histidine kinase